MIAYLLLFVSVSFAVINGCVLHSFNNRDIRNIGDTFFFNGGISAIWIVLLTAFSLISNDFVITSGSAIYGTIYGVIICSFLLFKNFAFTSGPVSLTTLIGSCPFILTTLFGLIFMDQSIKPLQIVGILMTIVSLFLCICPKKGEKISLKWLVFSSLFFLAGGGVGILYMLFGASDSKTEINGMMFCAACVAFVLYFLVGFVINLVNKNPCPKIHKSGLVFILLCGIASCTNMRLNLYLSTVIPSVVFFPLSNGSVVILSALSVMLLYKEKLRKIQMLGMVIGLAALVVIAVA